MVMRAPTSYAGKHLPSYQAPLLTPPCFPVLIYLGLLPDCPKFSLPTFPVDFMFAQVASFVSQPRISELD